MHVEFSHTGVAGARDQRQRKFSFVFYFESYICFTAVLFVVGKLCLDSQCSHIRWTR